VAGGVTEPALLELLPPPGRLTLDLACGQGRLARVLGLCAAMTRPAGLEGLSRALEGAGFVIEALREAAGRLVLRARRDA